MRNYIFFSLVMTMEISLEGPKEPFYPLTKAKFDMERLKSIIGNLLMLQKLYTKLVQISGDEIMKEKFDNENLQELLWDIKKHASIVRAEIQLFELSKKIKAKERKEYACGSGGKFP